MNGLRSFLLVLVVCGQRCEAQKKHGLNNAQGMCNSLFCQDTHLYSIHSWSELRPMYHVRCLLVPLQHQDAG